jgi:hypothetical protein
VMSLRRVSAFFRRSSWPFVLVFGACSLGRLWYEREAAARSDLPPPTESGAASGSLESAAPSPSGSPSSGGPRVVPKEVKPTSAPGNDASHHETLRVCAWNVQKLGHNNGKDFPVVKRVIEDHCDVTVLTEVMQKKGAAPGYDKLRSELGDAWTGLRTLTPRPNTNSGNSEFYAIVYRKTLLELCDGWSELVYAADGDGSVQARGPDVFVREPAFGCFRMRRQAGEFDFLLGAFHAKAHRGAQDRERTEAEVRALQEAIESVRKLRPGENDVLIAGDFNLTPDELASVTHLAVLQKGSGSTLSASGGRSANLLDGFLLESLALSPEVASSAEVLDVRKHAGSARTFARTVSDHLPVRLVLRVVGPDDD